MGQGDFMPTGGHYRKADPKQIQKILEGGIKAQVIRKKADEHHKAEEIPVAEDELMKDLKNIPD
jgi:hypothetical protein